MADNIVYTFDCICTIMSSAAEYVYAVISGSINFRDALKDIIKIRCKEAFTPRLQFCYIALKPHSQKYWQYQSQ